MRPLSLILVGLLVQASAADTQDKGKPATTRTSAPNIIDKVLDAKWKELKLTPNKRSTDEEFLRRVTVDLIGTIPLPSQIIEFTSTDNSKKRDQVIDKLLAGDDWAEYWADRLTSIFIGYRDQRVDAIGPTNEYLRDHLRKNTPYNRIVEEMLLAKGSNKEDKSTLFMMYWLTKDRTKKDLTVHVSKVFLGIQLQCAQCHDHPFEKWTKDDFFSMVANFAATNVKTVEKAERQRDSEYELFDAPRNRGYRPEGYKVNLMPKFIDGQPLKGDNSRRDFTTMLTAPENIQFARATVNRIWSIFMGIGFVEPVDDFSIKNQPSMPELLDELSREFVENNYDLRWLMKTIVSSKAYQLSSRRTEKQFSDDMKKYYVYSIVRPMSPEQMYNVLVRANGADEAVKAGRGRGMDLERGKRQFMTQVVQSMGDGGNSPSEYNASIQMIMRMLNMDSPMYRGIKARGGGAMTQILRQTKKPEEIITQMYLRTVSRQPSREELSHCMKYFQERKGAQEAYEDIYFVLMNTNEFFFNH